MPKKLDLTENLEKYIIDHSDALTDVQKEIIQYNISLGDQQRLQISVSQAQFLQTLIKISNIKKILEKVPQLSKEFFNSINDLKIYPVFVSRDFFEVNNNIHLIGDAFFAFSPSFAQGASQSIEGAYELFENIENNTESNFFRNRVDKTKMVNNRSKFNQFAFHLSNPLTTLLRNIFLKKLVKNKKFLEGYLGKIYKN